MSSFGKWCLGVGIVLMAVAVLCSVLDLIPASVFTGIAGLLAIGVAGYDALYYWTQRMAIRREAAKPGTGSPPLRSVWPRLRRRQLGRGHHGRPERSSCDRNGRLGVFATDSTCLSGRLGMPEWPTRHA
jgi:hypothetical protein